MDDTQRLQWLYELALARQPTAAEQAAALSFLAGDQGLVENSEETRPEEELDRQKWLSVCQAVLASNEFRHVK